MSTRFVRPATTLSGILVLLALTLCGCGESPNSGGAVALKLNVQLETPSLASQVEVVTLTIRYGGGAPIGPDTLNFDDGVIDDTLSVVPGDSVVFILRALNGTGLVLYEGRDTVGVVQPGSTLTIDITLRPAVLMLRAGPLIQEVELPGPSLIDVFVDVYNVDSLFGASFRAHYDTTILKFEGAVEGDFLKSAGPPGDFDIGLPAQGLRRLHCLLRHQVTGIEFLCAGSVHWHHSGTAGHASVQQETCGDKRDHICLYGAADGSERTACPQPWQHRPRVRHRPNRA